MKISPTIMTAYRTLQFLNMSDIERTALNKALLQYCELDTLAMVMVIEAWREALSSDGLGRHIF